MKNRKASKNHNIREHFTILERPIHYCVDVLKHTISISIFTKFRLFLCSPARFSFFRQIIFYYCRSSSFRHIVSARVCPSVRPSVRLSVFDIFRVLFHFWFFFPIRFSLFLLLLLHFISGHRQTDRQTDIDLHCSSPAI